MVRTGPKCFHFQTLKIFSLPWVSSVACFGSGHRAIYNSQLATLDVQFRKLCRSIVGPPPEVDWNAARFFIYGMNGSKILLQMYTLIHGLTLHAKNYWNLATHVAAFPAHRWVQRLPSWHPIGTRRVGRPRHTSESKLHAYCRYANLGSWRKVYDVVWNSHLPSFVNFCRMYIAIVYILCFLRVRLVTGSPQACRPDLKRPLVIVGFK